MLSSSSYAILPPSSLTLDQAKRGADPVLAASFGAIERLVGCRDQRLDVAGTRERRHAEARADGDVLAVRRQDLTGRDRTTCALGDGCAARRVGAREHERELLATPTARRVDVSHRPREGLGD